MSAKDITSALLSMDCCSFDFDLASAQHNFTKTMQYNLLDRQVVTVRSKGGYLPLQNRVTPYGDIIATEERGTLMGNRGILHVEGQIVRRSMHRGWITCTLNHENVHRKVMSEGKYTELFFLDEATAFSAGHRPCYNCQRERSYYFRSCWVRTNFRTHGLGNKSIAEIDRVLHRERITRNEEKVTYLDHAINVGRGAFVELEGKYYLKWGQGFYEWSPGGYVTGISIPHRQLLNVLTPKSVVRCFKNGFVPQVHGSIGEYC